MCLHMSAQGSRAASEDAGAVMPGLGGGADLVEDEFLRLLTFHKHDLFTLIFCIVRNQSDAEDVFQQAAMAMWKAFGEFRPGAKFLPWASQIARCRAVSFLRSQRRERLLLPESIVEKLEQDLAVGLDSVEIQQARLQALSKCRTKLSPVDQELLSMCYGGGTIMAAAARLGRPIRSVYTSLSRIRRALYDCIERALAREGRA